MAQMTSEGKIKQFVLSSVPSFPSMSSPLMVFVFCFLFGCSGKNSGETSESAVAAAPQPTTPPIDPTLWLTSGHPFTVMGFDWDYGGTITNWRGGKLGRPPEELPHVFIQLSPTEADTGAIRDSVSGDREFSSHDPRMQQINPHVQVLSVAYTLPRK